jgi:hypothetical protein
MFLSSFKRSEAMRKWQQSLFFHLLHLTDLLEARAIARDPAITTDTATSIARKINGFIPGCPNEAIVRPDGSRLSEGIT